MIRRLCGSLYKFEVKRKAVRKCARAALGLVFALAAGLGASAQVNVTTYHNDNMRSGQNTNETILTLSNVNVNSFGKLFSYSVDGYVYAQPLYVAGVTIGTGTQAGTTHNVIFIATQNDTVYAFDADSNGGANASPLWQVSLLGSGEKAVPNSDVSTSDIVPQIGITSTPVIDTTSNTIYVVAKSTVSDTSFFFRLHALDITTGQEKFSGPKLLQASVPGNGNGSSGGTLAFDALWENNRAGLLLQNGILYIAFASHGDNGPWHGWILAYNAKTLAQTSAFCSSPNAAGSGIWMSGAGLAADMPNPTTQPYGRMFAATGNGTFDAVTPYTTQMDYGDSVLHLDLTNGVITVADDFTPFNQASLNGGDLDLASGGTLLLPDQSSGGHTHLLVQVGKQGIVYLVDRDTMNGYSSSADNVVEEIPSGQTGGLWSMPAYWNNNVYFWGNGSNLRDFALSGGRLPSTPTNSGTISSNFPGATPGVSSNGTSNGIVWAIQTDAYGSNGPAVLRAFNATSVSTELYDSTQASSLTTNPRNDNAGSAVKFAVPTVTSGKVYVGTQGQVDVYGLLGEVTQVATPSISPEGKSFTGSLTVTITDSTSGATIHYTTDGSMPSASSPTFPSGGITVSTTETISAIATATGSLNSAVATQTYTLQTQVVAPAFSPAPNSYSGAQSVTITDATSGNTIYYTTDGSTPVPGQGTTKQYSGALAISTTTVLSAMATASGLTNSPVTSGTYTITTGSGGNPTINFSNGFSTSASSMTFNGSTDLDDTRLQLSNGGTNEANSAWYNTPVNIQSFTTNFTMQISNAGGDGMTFTIQNAGLTAVGPYGGGLGYGPDTPGGASNNGNTPIGNSVAIKFDLYNNAGEGTDSTGLYTNGASPTVPAIDMTSSGVNLLSGDTMNVQLVYNGTTLTMTITDAVAGTSFTTNWTVNIPSIVGGNTAYVGFTAGTGSATSSQKVETWTFTSGSSAAPAAATPTFSLAGGTYLGTQTVSISDTTSGPTIYYTTNGMAPTTSSTQYTGMPLTVSSTETVNAIAVASGYSASAVATATYTIESQVAAPTFSPAPGSYTVAQSVTISSTTSGATIYYTTNGTKPTTSSTQYSGAIAVTVPSTTIEAMAVKSGFFNSNVTTGLYAIGGSGGGGVISLGSGFSAASMVVNGNASINQTRLRLTDTGTNEAGSGYFASPVNIQQFTTGFNFQLTPGSAAVGNGITFVIQGGASTAVGPSGGGLGYGPDQPANPSASTNTPIANSVAVKFDLINNAGEGTDSTGLYTNGASPTTPAVDMTSSGVNLHNTGDVFNVQITYDGTNLTMTITDTTTNATFTHAWPINIPTTVGGNTAYVGFTGGTGNSTAIQEIINWTLTSMGGTTTPAAATPTFNPPAGSYTSAQSVSIGSTTSGATIYYTTDGSQPSTGSNKYSTAVNVAATETLSAIAVATGFSQSAVGTAAYTITTSGSSMVINDGSGFNANGLAMNGSAALNGTRLRLTPATTSLAGSGWFTTPVNIQTFTTDFTFQLANPTGSATGNGITFTIQNAGTTAVGPSGGGLGYGPDNPANPSASSNTPIGKSVAVKFDLINNAGEGNNSTGIYTNGASPTIPATTVTGGVVLNNGDIFHAHITYDGTTLTMTVTDTTNTANTFTTSWPINIPSTVGGNTAYVGFTGGTGNSVANQDIITWTFSNSGTTTPPQTPIVYATTSLAAVTSGPTFRTFAYAGFPDGNGTIMDSTAVGDNVTFTVPIPTAGTYDIKLSYKGINTRGISQLSINGSNVGAPLDQYTAGETYNIVDYGNFNFTAAGNYAFKFTIVGKNASSSGYGISFDDFTLTPQ
jgi:Legume lectin domain/Chitobiase/beta-hexosaminidase C-terminal domain